MKNEVELEGLRRAYRRDGAAYVRWLAWLDKEMKQRHQITEYEAAEKLTRFRETTKYFAGLAYENISGSGPNGGMVKPLNMKCRTKSSDIANSSSVAPLFSE